MAQITLRGNPLQTSGTLPEKGSKAPDFTLTNASLQDVSLRDFAGRKKVLNIFPSVDTGVCAASVRSFNQKASGKDGVVVLNISADLPFAAKRFCAAEGLSNVETLSTFRNPAFLKDYGVQILDGGMKGLASRAVVVLDEDDTVLYTQQVPEIGQEPDYDAALGAL